jgi:hypothetical protein
MNSKSKPGSAGENSRRDFIQRIGTAAAASSLAASVSSAQQQKPVVGEPGAGFRAERDFVRQPGPEAQQPMPTINLGKHKIGRLCLGINGIGSHYSDPLSRTYRQWATPDQLMKTLKHCDELGINLRIQTQNQVNDYNKQNDGHMLFSCNASHPILPDGSIGDPRARLKTLAALKPIAIHYAASASDDIWRRGQFNKVRDFCKMVQQDFGLLACVNGHIPEMYMKMEDEGWGVDYYMTGLYLFGRTHAEWEELFKFNPALAPLVVGQPATEDDSIYYGGEIAWVRGDPPLMLKVIKQVKTPCLAFKILASGNLMANAQPRLQQQIVEARYKYVFENIKSTDGVVVAMWNKYEDQYALNKEYVVKYSGLSVRKS